MIFEKTPRVYSDAYFDYELSGIGLDKELEEQNELKISKTEFNQIIGVR